MDNIFISIAGANIHVPVYKHSLLEYVVAKIIKAINASPDVFIEAYQDGNKIKFKGIPFGIEFTREPNRISDAGLGEMSDAGKRGADAGERARLHAQENPGLYMQKAFRGNEELTNNGD